MLQPLIFHYFVNMQWILTHIHSPDQHIQKNVLYVGNIPRSLARDQVQQELVESGKVFYILSSWTVVLSRSITLLYSFSSTYAALS